MNGLLYGSGGGLFLQCVKNCLGGLLTGADAVGYADAFVGVAGEGEAGDRGDGVAHDQHAFEMADSILRHGVARADDADKVRGRLEPEDC